MFKLYACVKPHIKAVKVGLVQADYYFFAKIYCLSGVHNLKANQMVSYWFALKLAKVQ